MKQRTHHHTQVVVSFSDSNFALILGCARLYNQVNPSWNHKKHMNVKHIEAIVENAPLRVEQGLLIAFAKEERRRIVTELNYCPFTACVNS